MSEEKIKQLMKEEMLKTIKNDLHSEMIFVYVDNLEKENKQLKDKIDKANEILSKSCFEYDNCPDNVINKIIELKEILGGKENV